MRIHNIYEDENGESHWRDLEIELHEHIKGNKLSDRMPATGIIFRENNASHQMDFHTAPRRQYVVNLSGEVRITASDGEARIMRGGDIMLVEDLKGRGHKSEALSDEVRVSLFIPIE